MHDYEELDANRFKLSKVCWLYYTFIPVIGIYLAFQVYIRAVHKNESVAQEKAPPGRHHRPH